MSDPSDPQITDGNYVFQLKVAKRKIDPFTPYETIGTQNVSGTAFMIDAAHGIMLTNAHVVENALTIIGRLPSLGLKDLIVELVSICHEKDLALCKIVPGSLKIVNEMYEDLTVLNMKMGDSMKLKLTDKVTAIGYPLGSESISKTTGDLSAFHNRVDDKRWSLRNGDYEDSLDQPTTYLQTSTAINPGNSGGPLRNEAGEVIGIVSAGVMFAQNIGYAIPSRTFLAVYDEMRDNLIVKIPTWSMNWNKSTDTMISQLCNSKKEGGIYVRNIYEDSFLHGLVQKGDFINAFQYEDIFWCCPNGFETVRHDHLEIPVNPKMMTCYFDKFGDIKLYLLPERYDNEAIPDSPPEDAIKQIKRNLTLTEITDMIPIGSRVRVSFCRDKTPFMVESEYINNDTKRRVYRFPLIQPYDYEVIAGLCFSEVSYNHGSMMDNIEWTLKPKCVFNSYVMISKVFEATLLSNTKILRVGDIVSEINDEKIETIDDIRRILGTTSDLLKIKTKSDKMFISNLNEALADDKLIYTKYEISRKHLLLGDFTK